MREEKPGGTVIPFKRNEPSGPKDNDVGRRYDHFLSIAKQLIADHATPQNDTQRSGRQKISGDRNLQLSTEPCVYQSIQGNDNLQIALSADELERMNIFSLIFKSRASS